MSPNKLQPVRGTHDILPDEYRKFRYIVDTARNVAESYGCAQMDTPIFEMSEVFHRTLGDTSDVVTKETYTFEDRGGEKLTLRPEFTAGIVRSFISNSLQELPWYKWFYAGPAFRYERPQKGRFRQFHQIGIEFLRIKSPLADIEAISMAYDLLKKLGLSDVTLEINTLGDEKSRAQYREALVQFFTQHKQSLSEDSRMRLERNPLRILDSKDEGDRKLIANAPNLRDYLTKGQDSAEEFYTKVTNGLQVLSIPFRKNEHLVRGLDYYNHTVFEFTSSSLGAQNAVLAGGRYDKLVETMGGQETAGIGWAAGVERLMEIVDFTRLEDFVSQRRPICITPVEDQFTSLPQLLEYAKRLRAAGHVVEFIYKGNLGKRLQNANKIKAQAVILLGEAELETNTVTIKHLDSRQEEKSVPADKLLSKLAIYLPKNP